MPTGAGAARRAGEEHERHGGDAQIQARENARGPRRGRGAARGPSKRRRRAAARGRPRATPWMDQNSLASAGYCMRVVRPAIATVGSPLDGGEKCRQGRRRRQGNRLLDDRPPAFGRQQGPAQEGRQARHRRGLGRTGQGLGTEHQCQQGHLPCRSPFQHALDGPQRPGQPGDAAEMRDERSGRDDGARTGERHRGRGRREHSHSPASQQREHSGSAQQQVPDHHDLGDRVGEQQQVEPHRRVGDLRSRIRPQRESAGLVGVQRGTPPRRPRARRWPRSDTS